ncbi:RNA polymerase sigma factor [Hymenobacter wooponensis]|uniref:Sigma-70 family RNA polymerase sigma factor n=1 Tax=Hymenobacter wooponensis TaxID=1525360 RepID=A0A4Z0MEF7_9BACT|nr:sigma-70 family RNA polymerase sigma factor [Hymenobacter wooponensis]TGD77678.1 sigma-70 family RNA polymerase sigma factor [Hymenobacter wooponensis]
MVTEQLFLAQLNQHLGIAYRIGQAYQPEPDERADLVQEMIYQLWRSYPSFTGQAKFSTWMYRVCLNTALMAQRTARKRPTNPLVAWHEQIPDPPPDDREQAIQELFEAIALLSPLNKAIVLLYLDDLSYEEIATITGLSKTNVSVRLVRIKKELKSRLPVNPTTL